MVILTTPLCDNIIDIKNRFVNITFNGNITKVIKIYSKDTIEYNKMIKENVSPLIKIITKDEENFIQYDENSGDIIL